MTNRGAGNHILTYRQTGQVKLKCSVRLDRLFADDEGRDRFDDKWKRFIQDGCNKDIYHLQGSTLFYDSEQLIPTKISSKPSLLLVLGNPASESVKRGMFFAADRDGQELSFWKHILTRSGLLPLLADNHLPAKALNRRRKKQLWKMDYDSPFRIGLTVFISMPSAAGGKWGCVAGIRRLFGAAAFKLIEKEETQRVVTCVRRFVRNNGAVITFQRNAWENLRSPENPLYTIDDAKKGRLTGTVKEGAIIPLFCVPPTRLAGPCAQKLKQFKAHILSAGCEFFSPSQTNSIKGI
jgi:hypothetical protein